MAILIRRPPDIQPSKITPPEIFRRRRELLKAAGTALAFAGAGVPIAWPASAAAEPIRLFGVRKSPLSIDEKQTPYDVVTTYNNFYEFGTDKSDPAENATRFRVAPWSVAVEGEIKRPKVYDI